jgi:hypothetical protein
VKLFLEIRSFRTKRVNSLVSNHLPSNSFCPARLAGFFPLVTFAWWKKNEKKKFNIKIFL